MMAILIIKMLILISNLTYTTSKYIRNYNLENITWITKELHEFPTLYFELDFKATFPDSLCCPMVAISIYKNHFPGCFPEGFILPDSWYKNALFYLEPKVSDFTNIVCTKNTTVNIIDCKTLHVVDQDYAPKQRYIHLGYPCSAVKNITQLDFHLTMYKEVNETTCQVKKQFDQPGKIFDCREFYPFTSLPNAYGDMSQAEAEKSISIFNNYFNHYKGKHCHKYLMKLVCMTFLPMCPFNQLNESDSVLSNNIFKTDYLIPPCKEGAFEVKKACETDIKLLQDTSIDYYPPQNGSVICHYERVQCDKPPIIENGKLVDNDTIFYAKDVVYYSCHKEFEMSSETNFSVCSYSGLWTDPPACVNPKANLTLLNIKKGGKERISSDIMVALIIVGCLVLLTTVLVVKAIQRWVSKRINGEYNLDTVSRNRPYDAFVSYESGARDEQFVRKEICPKLDSEHGGNFRLLIHQRDFKAGVLILDSIQNAVRDSNCAIILLSQTYIRSQWCKQEFEECMEECRKDSNYRLLVILMQPVEILQKEKLTSYMKAFLRSKTYLERKDSKLWDKLEELLGKHKTQQHTLLEAETKL